MIPPNRLILSAANSTVLTLLGRAGDNGSYACRLNNSQAESIKYFKVKFSQEPKLAVGLLSLIVIVVIVLLVTVIVGVKLYRDKVSQISFV